MSRRHSSSRRRSYGRRQHEVRERRPGAFGRSDWNGGSGIDDWRSTDLDQERPTTASDEAYGSLQP